MRSCFSLQNRSLWFCWCGHYIRRNRKSGSGGMCGRVCRYLMLLFRFPERRGNGGKSACGIFGIYLCAGYDDERFSGSWFWIVIAGIPCHQSLYRTAIILGETDHSPKAWICIILLGIIQFGCSYIFLSRGLDRVSPITASLTSTLEPILNPILVAIFCGETIGRTAVVGAVLVIGAAACYNVYEAAHKD